jgi:hypothetical protein
LTRHGTMVMQSILLSLVLCWGITRSIDIFFVKLLSM